MHERKIKRPGLSPALLILIPAIPIKDIGTRQKRSRPAESGRAREENEKAWDGAQAFSF